MSSYLYEQSDPERFQQLCQALLLSDHPDLQCFPVAQQDGGRDGLAADPVRESVAILQVKFKRHDDTTDDLAAWVIKTLEGELPKINHLITNGATKYIFATNARGTAAPGGGRIDRVQNWLKENVNIPAQCLWRDDLDRRLETSMSLQWRYPEILTGTDGIRLALENSISEDKNRRARAIRAFVADQFKRDAEVKFKQVDLRNDLLALFIDVPAALSERAEASLTNRQKSVFMRLLTRDSLSIEYEPGDAEAFRVAYNAGQYGIFHPQNVNIGTANLLLDRDFQVEFPRLVLEGAPGQGKSTLAQYICQVHRARFLDNSEILAVVPPTHRESPVRLPIKVDLRDLASWLNQKDPFVPDHPSVRDDWEPSLEAFLARQINFQSGGIKFTAYDVVEVLAGVPTLLFLDGLDEVADIDTRKALIDAVRHGLQRLESGDVNLQVVITSRPAAFANSPGFSSNEFAYLELRNLPRSLAFNYAEKWTDARDLDAQDAAEVLAILRDKLDLPHIRDLARNPMQLAILLGLIHSVGYSLPDERTDLYRSYMDKFLTREAEKSPAVRRHRPLLVKLHQHLAWILQSNVERAGGSSGSVTADELRKIVAAYLREKEHPSDILDDLFTGMLERVYVLIQRIDGTYEFEVQPIREFFCAAHLYETAAAYADTRIEPKGTRTERFDAIARNRYWTNVARFYAGFCTSGELGGLFLQIEDLAEDEKYNLSFRARQLGAMLLSDWVFKDNPRATRHVADCIFDDLGLYGASSGFGLNVYNDPISLPDGCGRAELVQRVVQKLDIDPAMPARYYLTALLDRNPGEELFGLLEDRIRNTSGSERSMWLSVACSARVLGHVEASELYELIAGDNPPAGVLRRRTWNLLSAYPAMVERSLELTTVAIEGARDFETPSYFRYADSWLVAFLTQVSLGVARMRVSGGSPAHISNRSTLEGLSKKVPDSVGVIRDVLIAARDAESSNPGEWTSSLRPWNVLVEAIRKNLGESSWLAYHLATAAAAIRSSSERGRGASSLFDHDVPLCDRARSARLRTGGSAWWSTQFADARSPEDLMFWGLLLMTWGSPKVIENLQDELDEVLQGLPEEEYDLLFNATAELRKQADESSSKFRDRVTLKRDASSRIRAIVAVRYPSKVTNRSLAVLAKDPEEVIRRWARRQQLDDTLSATSLSEGQVHLRLKEVREYFSAYGMMPSNLRRLRSGSISDKVVGDVLGHPLSYPYELVAHCESIWSSRLRSKSIATVAVDEGWTFE